MSASLKPVPGRHLRGMRQLGSKILDLQNQYQALLKERPENIATIISTLDLASLEDSLIIGSLLFLKEKVTAKDHTELAQVEASRDAGEKFLRRSKPQSHSCKGREQAKDFPPPRKHEGGKQEKNFPYPHKQKGAEQAGAHPQLPSEKNASPKQTTSPQTTPQSPQKQSQPREA